MGSEGNFGQALRSLRDRFAWGLADQALSSLTNFALGLLAARVLSASDFGSFALVFAAYLIGLGAVRATSGEPFVIRFTAVSPAEWKRGVASATGTALVLGVVAGLGCILAAVLIGQPLGRGLFALGITMPGLLLQDTWRFTFFARRKGAAAFTNDLVWAGGLAAGIGALLATDSVSVGWLVIMWGGAGTLAGVFGVFQASVAPHPGNILEWLHQHKDLVPRYLAEYAATTLVGAITAFGLGAIAGLAQVGALRAGQLLLGPLSVLFMGVGIVAVPEAVHSLLESGPRLVTYCRRLSITLAASAVGMGTVIWALPDRVGFTLLRQNWVGAQQVVFPLAVGMAAFGVLLGAGVGLRALAAARLSLRARLYVAPLSLVGGLGGAVLGGAAGAAWGMAMAFMVGGVVWWSFFLRGMRENERRAGASLAATETLVAEKAMGSSGLTPYD